MQHPQLVCNFGPQMTFSRPLVQMKFQLVARSSNGNITVRGALFKKYQNSRRAVQMQK
jgi:hypothetical protein